MSNSSVNVTGSSNVNVGSISDSTETPTKLSEANQVVEAVERSSSGTKLIVGLIAVLGILAILAFTLT